MYKENIIIKYNVVIGRIDYSKTNNISVKRVLDFYNDNQANNYITKLDLTGGDCAIITKSDYSDEELLGSEVINRFGFGKIISFAGEFGDEYEYMDSFNEENNYYLVKSDGFYCIGGDINVPISTDTCNVLSRWETYIRIVGC